MTRTFSAVVAVVVVAMGAALVSAPAPPLTPPPGPIAPAPDIGNEVEEISERARWFNRARTFPGLAVSPGRFHRAVARADALEASGGALAWEPLGPDGLLPAYDPIYQGKGPISGRVSSIATHPTDRDVAYIGTAGGGVWKTTDGGVSWTALFDDQPSIGIGAVAVSPTNGDVVYAGTGEADTAWELGSLSARTAYFGTGLYRSIDGGDNWSKLTTRFDGCFFSDLVVAPDDPNDLFAAVQTIEALPTSGTVPACEAGVWLSEDGGTTWIRSGLFVPWEIEIDPRSPSVLYASAQDLEFTAKTQGGRGGVYKSLDRGRTWLRLVGGLPPTGYGRVEIALARSDPQRLYAAFQRTGTWDLLGVWTSADGGLTWTPVVATTQPCSYSGLAVDLSQCFYDLVIAVDPTDPLVFYVGGVKLYRYTVGGGAPGNIGDGSTGIHVDQHALAHDASGRLWVGNDGGMYRTPDRGTTFANLNTNLEITQFYPGISGWLARDAGGVPRGPILGGSQDNGTALFEGVPLWKGVLGADGGFSAVNPKNPNIMFASTQGGFYYKSTNRGKTWTATGPGAIDLGAFVAPLVMHPGKPEILYAGRTRVSRTENTGTSWTAISPVLDGSPVWALAPAPSNKDVVYAGTSLGNVFVTKNASSWEVSKGLPLRIPTDFAVDATDPAIAYVTFGGYGSGHVFKTTDYGVTWQDISQGLPDAPTNAIVVDDDGTLYVGSDVGLFARSPGAAWRAEGDSLPNTIVMDLLLDRTDGSVIAATHGRGLWVARLPH